MNNNTSRTMIDAMKKRVATLASAMEGVEATAMYASIDYPDAINGEDILFLAKQVKRIQRSADGVRKALTNPIKSADYFSEEQAAGALSGDEISLIRQFAMSEQEALDFSRTSLAESQRTVTRDTATIEEKRVLNSLLENS